jgi:hypothetical protein
MRRLMGFLFAAVRRFRWLRPTPVRRRHDRLFKMPAPAPGFSVTVTVTLHSSVGQGARGGAYGTGRVYERQLRRGMS